MRLPCLLLTLFHGNEVGFSEQRKCVGRGQVGLLVSLRRTLASKLAPNKLHVLGVCHRNPDVQWRCKKHRCGQVPLVRFLLSSLDLEKPTG